MTLFWVCYLGSFKFLMMWIFNCLPGAKRSPHTQGLMTLFMLTVYSACIKTGTLLHNYIFFLCIQHNCILQDSRCLFLLFYLNHQTFCCIQVWHSWRVDRDGPHIEAWRSSAGEGRGGRPQQGYVDHSRHAMGVPNGRPRGRSLREGEDYGLCEDLLGWCSLKHDYVIITCYYYYSVLFVGCTHWFKSTTLEHLYLTCPKEPAQLCVLEAWGPS